MGNGFSRESLQRFGQRRRKLLVQAYGREVSIAGRDPVCAIIGTVTREDRLDQGGFLDEVEAVLRMPRCLAEIAPKVGERLVDLSNQRSYVIAQLKEDPLELEWIAGLRAES